MKPRSPGASVPLFLGSLPSSLGLRERHQLPDDMESPMSL